MNQYAYNEYLKQYVKEEIMHDVNDAGMFLSDAESFAESTLLYLAEAGSDAFDKMSDSLYDSISSFADKCAKKYQDVSHSAEDILKNLEININTGFYLVAESVRSIIDEVKKTGKNISDGIHNFHDNKVKPFTNDIAETAKYVRNETVSNVRSVKDLAHIMIHPGDSISTNHAVRATNLAIKMNEDASFILNFENNVYKMAVSKISTVVAKGISKLYAKNDLPKTQDEMKEKRWDVLSRMIGYSDISAILGNGLTEEPEEKNKILKKTKDLIGQGSWYDSIKSTLINVKDIALDKAALTMPNPVTIGAAGANKIMKGVSASVSVTKEEFQKSFHYMDTKYTDFVKNEMLPELNGKDPYLWMQECVNTGHVDPVPKIFSDLSKQEILNHIGHTLSYWDIAGRFAEMSAYNKGLSSRSVEMAKKNQDMITPLINHTKSNFSIKMSVIKDVITRKENEKDIEMFRKVFPDNWDISMNSVQGRIENDRGLDIQVRYRKDGLSFLLDGKDVSLDTLVRIDKDIFMNKIDPIIEVFGTKEDKAELYRIDHMEIEEDKPCFFDIADNISADIGKNDVKEELLIDNDEIGV